MQGINSSINNSMIPFLLNYLIVINETVVILMATKNLIKFN